jgi:hypothetical protein
LLGQNSQGRVGRKEQKPEKAEQNSQHGTADYESRKESDIYIVYI